MPLRLERDECRRRKEQRWLRGFGLEEYGFRSREAQHALACEVDHVPYPEVVDEVHPAQAVRAHDRSQLFVGRDQVSRPGKASGSARTKMRLRWRA